MYKSETNGARRGNKSRVPMSHKCGSNVGGSEMSKTLLTLWNITLLLSTTAILPDFIRLILNFESDISIFNLIDVQMSTTSSVRRRADKPRRPSQATTKRGFLNVNRTGILAFPDELLLEMIRHIPRVPVSCHTAEEILSQDTTALDSHFTLTALSQTCQRLRHFFLPYVYRIIEVLDRMKIVGGRRLSTPERREKQRLVQANSGLYTKELVRQLEVVTVRNPSLAQYVGALNVVVTTSDCYTSLAKHLWDYLVLLPNLKSVRMVCQYNWMSMADPKKWRLPQIRHVHLNGNATAFALSCPNLVSISTSHAINITKNGSHWGPAYDWRMLPPATKKNLEIIGTNCVIPRNDISAFSNLRDISFECLAIRDIMRGHRQSEVKNMHLETIRIQADQIGFAYVPLPNDSERMYAPRSTRKEEEHWITWCEKMLRQVQKVDRKDKKIYYTSRSGETWLYLLDARFPTERRIIKL